MKQTEEINAYCTGQRGNRETRDSRCRWKGTPRPRRDGNTHLDLFHNTHGDDVGNDYVVRLNERVRCSRPSSETNVMLLKPLWVYDVDGSDEVLFVATVLYVLTGFDVIGCCYRFFHRIMGTNT